MNTEKKVFDYINEYGLIKEGDSIVAGVSGGADSMCMLLLLMRYREICDFTLTVAHVDHGIRGEEAKADAGFVRDFCAKHGIGFELGEADILRIAKDTGTTCEEAGRNFRYEFFARTAEKYGAEKIATAHTKGDNAETVLFNIFRGSGIKGLKGIIPKRALKQKNGEAFTVIRPVLCLSREEIEAYLEEKGQAYKTDATNSEDTYSRNRLRNRILPEIKEYINNGVYSHIESLSLQAAETMDYIEQQTDVYMDACEYMRDASGHITGCRIDCKMTCGLHPVLRKSIIRRAFEQVAGRLKDVEEVHISDIDGLYGKQSGRKLSMPYGITAVKEYDTICLKTKETVQDQKADDISRTVSISIHDRAELRQDIPKGKNEKWFDYEKMQGTPTVRTMEPGDYLLIGPEKHKKSLNRFMIDNKIPKDERDSIPLLAVGNHVVWVVGYRQDESCLVTSGTKKVLVAKSRRTSVRGQYKFIKGK